MGEEGVWENRKKRGITCSSEDNGACGPHLHPREMDQLVLPNHDLLDHLAAAQLGVLGVVKGRCDLAACNFATNLR